MQTYDERATTFDHQGYYKTNQVSAVLTQPSGHKNFRGPEVLERKSKQMLSYDNRKADVFSLGALLWMLLFNVTPFKEDESFTSTNTALAPRYSAQVFGDGEVLVPELDKESLEIQRIAISMLQLDPKLRPPLSPVLK